jgi:predicted house-cleaning noncanonical NTP pyrophosphatase (MazG superfamily)
VDLPQVVKVKLVRDNITARGPQEVVRKCNTPAGLLGLLCAKLHEEAQEIADDPKNPEEYGDLYEVMLRIMDLNGVSWSEVEDIRIAKAKEKGSFDKGMVLIVDPSDADR